MQITAAEYKKIISFGSADIPPPPIERLVCVRFIAADNTIGRSLRTWSRQALDSIGSRLIGMPYTTDHNWGEIEHSKGIVFDGKVWDLPAIPRRLIDNYAYKLNKKIIGEQGWTPVVIKVAFYEDSDIFKQLSLGSAGKVSIGGFGSSDIWCPLCNVSFFNRDVCKHVPPSPYYDTGENTAPYTIRANVEDMGEISLVLIPNSPSAGMITNDLAELFRE